MVPEIDGITDLREIGRGGFGVVYRGVQTQMERTVAVKVLPAVNGGPDQSRAFDREVRAMGRLSGHPAVVQVFSIGRAPDGSPYLLMPWMEGGSLADRIASGPIPPATVVSIGVTVAGALSRAHELGILHRDIKPDNILFDAQGRAHLADFGIARLANTTSTKVTGVTATVLYAAPEVLSGEPASIASDVYSLAATLYHAVAGAPAFISDDVMLPALMARIISTPMPVDPLRRAGASDALIAVFSQAMSKDPSDRPRDMQAFATALDSSTAGTTARLSGPPPLVPEAAEQPHPSPPRRRLLVGGVAVVALVAGGTVAALMATDGPPGGPEAPASAPPDGVDRSGSAAGPQIVVASTEVRPTASGGVTVQEPASVSASATAPPGVDSSGAPVTYDAEHLIDGDPETAWRVPGDGTGSRLRFSFPDPVRLTEISLIPGYARVDPFDGTDRFPQNRRVRSASYELGDDTTWEATFSDSPELQALTVDGDTTEVTVAITGTSGPAERDFTAISEVVFRGAPLDAVPAHVAAGEPPQHTVQQFLTLALSGRDASELGTAAAVDGARALVEEAGDDPVVRLSACQVDAGDALACSGTIEGAAEELRMELRLSWPAGAELPSVVDVRRGEAS